MTQRYIYQRLTPAQFKAAQEETGLGGFVLARLLGYPITRLQKWEQGQDEIPHIVAVAMAMLTVPKAKEIAWAVTNHAIVGRADKKERDDA